MKREKRLHMQAAENKRVRDVLKRCPACGADIPHRDGEGTCPKCDPEGVARHVANRAGNYICDFGRCGWSGPIDLLVAPDNDPQGLRCPQCIQPCDLEQVRKIKQVVQK